MGTKWRKRFNIVVVAIAVVGTLVVIGAVSLLICQRGFESRESEHILRQRLEANGSLVTMRGLSQGAFDDRTIPKLSESPQLRNAGVQFIMPIRSNSSIEGVAFVFGSADQHYGVIVSRPGASPKSRFAYTNRWTTDVYYFSETINK